jgi:hypothetical protein
MNTDALRVRANHIRGPWRLFWDLGILELDGERLKFYRDGNVVMTLLVRLLTGRDRQPSLELDLRKLSNVERRRAKVKLDQVDITVAGETFTFEMVDAAALFRRVAVYSPRPTNLEPRT